MKEAYANMTPEERLERSRQSKGLTQYTHCVYCGSEKTRNYTNRCRPCRVEHSRKPKRRCSLCAAEISHQSKSRTGKCRKCYLETMQGNFTGRTHTPEARKKLSEARSKAIAEGSYHMMRDSGRGKKGWYKSIKTGEDNYYDSALELIRMQQLDEDPDVIEWTKNHGIRIPYGNNFYVPDFKVKRIDRTEMEEVKGWGRNTEQKKIALREYCDQNGYVYRWSQLEDICSNRYYRRVLKEMKLS